MKIQSILALILVSIGIQAIAIGNFGDSASGLAKQKIIQRLQIKKVSDLNFGEAAPGDPSKTVAPGNSENPENASFEVNGEPYRLYQIILPSDDSVKLITGSGGMHKEISIKSFSSFPASFGTIGKAGKAMIYVGAARESISSRQEAGEYLGQFYVTVVY